MQKYYSQNPMRRPDFAEHDSWNVLRDMPALSRQRWNSPRAALRLQRLGDR
jgi:hypothetical protein